MTEKTRFFLRLAGDRLRCVNTIAARGRGFRAAPPRLEPRPRDLTAALQRFAQKCQYHSAAVLERPERQRFHRARQRLERLTAMLVVKAGQPTMPVRIVFEADLDARLFRGDGPVTAHAPGPVRAAAARRHWIEGHAILQMRFAVPSRWHADKARPRTVWSAAAANLGKTIGEKVPQARGADGRRYRARSEG